MFKKLLATAILVCSIPVLANAAWQFTTQVKTQGGTISTPKLAGQTVNQSTVYKTYTTHTQLQAISVDALPGWTISKIVQDGVTIMNPASPYTSSVNGGAGANTSHSLYATFLATKLTVAASVTNPAGGSVSPTTVGNVFPGTQYAKLIFTFTPKAGYKVSGITGVGSFVVSPAGGDTGSAAVGQTVTVTIPAGTVLSSGVNLVGTFATNAPVVNAGSPQTVLAGKTVTLNGSVTGASSYLWTQTAGSTVTLSDPAVLAPTFTAAAAGTYQFKLVATAGALSSTAYTNVVATNSYITTMTNQCINCHNQNGVGIVQSTDWLKSSHATPSANTTGAMCSDCHIGADTGGHPGVTVTSATCESCHTATLSTTTHPVAITASKCITCHNAHDPAAGIASLAPTAHPAVTLYTFEEIGMQMAGGAKVPVQVDASGKGMPYSPKQTCGTSGCHVKNGVDYTYDKISDHAFHSNEGRSEYFDSADGKFDATKNKPWTQSTAMVGKW